MGKNSRPARTLSLKTIKGLISIESFVLFLGTIAVLVFFRDSQWDLTAARFFYHPEQSQDAWYEQRQFLWDLLYRGAPVLTAGFLIPSLLLVGISKFSVKIKPYRKQALFIFMLVAIGPGLMINTVFKPHWGRPRPREVLELGGYSNYHNVQTIDWNAEGKSFPCGHCSVGFAFTGFWWIFRRRKNQKVIANWALISGLGLGGLMGASRMAAGGHFLSDIICSGLIVGWVGLFLDRLILQEPNESNQSSASLLIVNALGRFRYFIWGLALLGSIAAVLVATPFEKRWSEMGPAVPLKALIVLIDQGHVELRFDETQPEAFRFTGAIQGFGAPGHKVDEFCTSNLQDAQCEVHRSGLFSDYESQMNLVLNPKLIGEFHLTLQRGLILDQNYPKPKGYEWSIKRENP